jgi:cell division protein FtsI/penicillin-binding protein 2
MVSKDCLNRLSLLALMGALLWGCLALRLGIIQVYDRESYQKRAQHQQMRSVLVSPKRGRIFDRNLEIMALNVPVESFGVRKLFTAPAPKERIRAFIAQVADYTRQDPAALTQRILRAKGFTYLARAVDLETSEKIKQLPDYAVFKRHIQIDQETKRLYPYGMVGGQIVGFSTDGTGRAGFELSQNELLTGKEGYGVVQVDGYRRGYARVAAASRPATDGADLVLTIDAACQAIAEKTLHDTVEKHQALGGMIIVMQPSTGDILAMASEPAFDPNDPRAYPMAAQKMRPIVDTYEPGSTFKLVAATAALDTRQFTTADMIGTNGGRISVGSHTITDHEQLGTLSLRQVIEHSSNVGTIKIAMAVGAHTYYDYVRRFGFGMKTGIALPGEAKGVLLNPVNWSGSTLPTMAIGYGVSVTGLQLLTAYAAIANGGWLMEPQIIKAVIAQDGAVKRTEPAAIRRVMEPETAAIMREILTGVVEEGTGKNAAIAGYKVAGKTGTAWKAREDGPGYTKKYRSSFIGMFPADNPQVAALVMIDEPRADGYYGGTVAAPAFRNLVERMIHLPNGPIHDLPPPKTEDGTPLFLTALEEIFKYRIASAVPDSMALPDSIRTSPQPAEEIAPIQDLELQGDPIRPANDTGPRLPSVIGLSLREAVTRLSKERIHVTVVGSGRVVRQDPAPGSPMTPGDRCRIECRPFEQNSELRN